MTKEEFQELLKRYRAGDCSLEEIERINVWFARISDEKLELNEFEKAHMKDRIRTSLQTSITQDGRETRKITFAPLMMKAAAGLLIIMLVGYFWTNRVTIIDSGAAARHTASVETISYKNNTPETSQITLPDLSTVDLKPGAEITYSKQWTADRREIQLVGEAFFEVTKDSKRPFFVYGGKVITKVLGTSFSVKAAKNAETIDVEVRTGKVSVYEEQPEGESNINGSKASGVILTPNEKVRYFVSNKHWVTSLVESPKPLPASHKEVNFIFNNTPLNEIVESIERTYSIDIIMENEAQYSSCAFNGDVSMMELYDLLEVICKSTGTTYEVKGTKILISGDGCH